MGFLEALVLGVVQGATEFLPVSSSGHLVILPAALGWDSPSLVFDTTVHLATLLALVAAFWRDFIELLVAWWQGLRQGRPLGTPAARLAWWVILGTVPGVLAGVFLENTFESLFASPQAAGVFLLLTAVLLVLAELFGRCRRELTGMGWLDSLIIGIGQAAAIAPGLSRSGTTISFAMYRGFTRSEATRFSFILSAPIIAGAALWQFIGQAGSGNLSAEAPALIVGFLAAAVCGYVAIQLLLGYVRRRSFYPFAVYCVVVGALALAFL